MLSLEQSDEVGQDKWRKIGSGARIRMKFIILRIVAAGIHATSTQW